MIPSYYRAALLGRMEISVHDEEFPVNASLRWSRLLYDWYANQQPQPQPRGTPRNPRSGWPVVIDADDLINETWVMPRLCALADLDPEFLATTWEKASPAQKQAQGHMLTVFRGAAQDSTGVIKSSQRAADIDIDEMAKAWTTEFGAEPAAIIACYAKAAMGDYLYLRQFRLE